MGKNRLRILPGMVALVLAGMILFLLTGCGKSGPSALQFQHDQAPKLALSGQVVDAERRSSRSRGPRSSLWSGIRPPHFPELEILVQQVSSQFVQWQRPSKVLRQLCAII